ncbi:lysoplasmalogenase [Lacihabitans soyangensis]|uniref:Lysoplasmalogenase n=1 Tax=Lacihabitans soyangensis TaxID=869394 RepID=A0AAE3H963_9BACT|nr:lysoplasmalogenase [Lacihabitans soyangensis]MCP9765855.1 lysoplasmalogenase [Lacihabitans soyangensis]
MFLRVIFFIVLAVEIYFSTTHQNNLVKFTKPLLMPLLIFMAFQLNIKERNLFIALFFSLLGDVFLMFGSELYFMLGLGSFLVAHVFYILLFKTQFNFSLLKSLPFAAATFGYILFIKAGIGQNLLIPVSVYCFVITLMGIFAAGRKTNIHSYNLVLLGSILFIVSDSLIAFNKFYSPLPASSFWVMSTYGIAQFLIVLGWSKK